MMQADDVVIIADDPSSAEAPVTSPGAPPGSPDIIVTVQR